MKKQIFLILTFTFLAIVQNNTTNAAIISSIPVAETKITPEEATVILYNELKKKNPNLDTIRKTLDYGAKVNATDSGGNPLIWVTYIKHPTNIALIELLLLYGANPNSMEDESGETLLYDACHTKNINLVDLLLQRNANPNIPNELGGLPLTLACNKNNPTLVKTLLDYGANPIKSLMVLSKPFHTTRNKDNSRTIKSDLDYLSLEVLEILRNKLSDRNPEAAPFCDLLDKEIQKKQK